MEGLDQYLQEKGGGSRYDPDLGLCRAASWTERAAGCLGRGAARLLLIAAGGCYGRVPGLPGSGMAQEAKDGAHF